MKIVDNYKKINKMVEDASNVFVVGHRDLDLDALGSCLAMYNYVENLQKDVYLIFDDTKSETAVNKVIKELNNVKFITSDKTKKIKNGDSLLIIVDTNKKYLLQAEELDLEFDKKIIIDHHEKNEDTIKDGLIIIDKDASSTCEMMTEFLKLNNFTVDSNLATILLSGIVLDTNNYVVKTDSNTFYYSYYLTTCGADASKVQYLLKQDLNKYIKRQQMITSVKTFNNIAITKGLNKEVYRKEELAKTADSLLMFNEIEASFVIAKIENNSIGISARSMGNINVGQILGMLGGGGDANFAAASIEDATINKVEKELMNIIKLL